MKYQTYLAFAHPPCHAGKTPTDYNAIIISQLTYLITVCARIVSVSAEYANSKSFLVFAISVYFLIYPTLTAVYVRRKSYKEFLYKAIRLVEHL